MIDTRASKSYVSQKVWQNLQNENLVHLVRANVLAKLADGTSVKILGLVNINIQFKNRQLNVQFRVLPKLDTDFVFGMDIIRKSKYQFRLTNTIGAIVDQQNNKLNLISAMESIMDELKTFRGINAPTTYGEHKIKLRNPK